MVVKSARRYLFSSYSFTRIQIPSLPEVPAPEGVLGGVHGESEGPCRPGESLQAELAALRFNIHPHRRNGPVVSRRTESAVRFWLAQWISCPALVAVRDVVRSHHKRRLWQRELDESGCRRPVRRRDGQVLARAAGALRGGASGGATAGSSGATAGSSGVTSSGCTTTATPPNPPDGYYVNGNTVCTPRGKPAPLPRRRPPFARVVAHRRAALRVRLPVMAVARQRRAHRPEPGLLALGLASSARTTPRSSTTSSSGPRPRGST